MKVNLSGNLQLARNLARKTTFTDYRLRGAGFYTIVDVGCYFHSRFFKKMETSAVIPEATERLNEGKIRLVTPQIK